MSGALKTVGKIAGVVGAVALIGSGIGAALGGTMLFTAFGASIAAGTIATIAGAVSVGASLLAGKGTPPAITETTDRLNASIDTRTPRKMVWGTTAMATDIRDQEYTESQKFLHRWIVVASHRVHSIREIWFDDKLAWTLAGGPQGEFAPWLQVQIRTEGSAANAINISSRMGSSRRYTGLAYVYLRYQILAQSKKLDSVFNQSVPSRITIIGDAALIYDPRKDSTVPGGSGSHRADDQSTWEWDANAARNPALQLLWYMLGWQINGLLAVGKGIPPVRIDLESFAIAANICDEPVSIPGGGTEPRYRSDGICSEGDSPTAVLDNLKATMNADLDDVGGKLRLTIFHNDLDSPVATFTDDDILGEFSWRPSVSLDDQFNIVRGTYIDPSTASLYQPNDYPQIEFASPDGIDRVLPLDFPFIQSVNQPQRLANLRLQRQKIAGLFRAEFQATGWRAQKNAIVTLSFKPRGWVDKLFRVVELEHREDGVVPMLLREEHPDLYDPPAYGAGNEAVAPTPYDPQLSPVVQAANETAAAAALSVSYTIGLAGLVTISSDGTSATVTIPNHTRVYQAPFEPVPVTGGAITGLALETTYWFYYDDPTLAGGSVTIQHTTDPNVPYFSAAHPFRHFLAFVTTPNAGGTGGGAGGSGTPGSGGWRENQFEN